MVKIDNYENLRGLKINFELVREKKNVAFHISIKYLWEINDMNYFEAFHSSKGLNCKY